MLRGFAVLFLLIHLCTSWSEGVSREFLDGQKEFQAGNLGKAAKFFRLSLQSNPDHVASYFALGKLYFLDKKPLEAFKYLRETLALEASYEDASSLFEQTLGTIKRLKPVRNPSPEILSALIYMDLRQNKLQEAYEKIKPLTKNHPDFSFAWDHLANFYYRQKRLDQALIYVKKALSLNPSSPTIFKHYQTVYFLKTHKRLPSRKKPPPKEARKTSIETKLIEQWVKQDSKTSKIAQGSKTPVTDSVNAVKDSSFFEKLLKQEVKKLPSKTTAQPIPTAIKKEPKYIPPPPVKKENRLEQKTLEIRAKKAFEARNWEIAATSFAILFQNNPSRIFFKQRFQESRRFDEFERDFRKARRSLARARTDPSLYKKARLEFLALNSATYLRLYNKASFDEFLARIAFSKNQFSKTVDLCRSWLRQEPENVTALYILLKSLDVQGLHAEGYKVFQAAKGSQLESLMILPGISRLVLKLKFLHYWWVLLVLVVFWGAITLGYLSFKVSIRNQATAKKQRLQSVRDLASESRWLEMVRKIDSVLLEELSDSEIYNLQYMKANGLYQAGNLDSAYKQCKSMLARYVNDQQFLVLLGRIMVGLKQTGTECLEPYRLLTMKEPKNLKALKATLRTLKQEKIFTQETETLAISILDLENYNDEALKDLVLLYLKHKPTDVRCLEIIKRYLDLHPGDTAVLGLYIEILGENGDYIEVIRWGKKLLDRSPELESAHKAILRAYGELNMVDEGRSYYHQLSLDYPHSPVIQQGYALILNSTGFLRPTESSPGPKQHTNLAEDALKMGKKLIDERRFQEALAKLQLASHDAHFKQEAGLLTLKSYLKMEDIPSALFYLNRLNLDEILLNQDGLEVIYEIAEYYLNTDQPKEALKLFRLIAKTDVSYRDCFQKIELLTQTQA
jgi:tetratricopeptide (TPR) repeat protein